MSKVQVNATNERVSKIVRDWYDYGRNAIPHIQNYRFGSFAGSATTLGSAIADKVDYRYIVDAKAPAAYIDNEKQVIAIPGWYFSTTAIQKLFPDDVEIDFEAISLALCNGSHLHETLHYAYTERVELVKLLKVAIGSLPADLSSKYEALLNSNYGATIINVSEDLRIEGFPVSANSKMLSISVFLRMKNAILFQDASFEDICNSMETATTDIEKLAARINVAISMKNIELRNKALSSSNETIKLIAYSAKEIASRSMITSSAFVILFKVLVDGLIIEADEVEKTEGGDGSEEGKGDRGDSTASPIEKEAFAAMTDEEKEELDEFASSFSEAAEHEAKKAADTKNDPYATRPVTYQPDITKLNNDVSEKLRESPDWSFVSLLKQLRSKNHTPGELQKSGNKLTKTHLNRIATDGKIFSTNSFVRNTQRNLEIIILVDFSGSMSGIMKDVVSTTFGFFSALKKVGLKADVYGHTAVASKAAIPLLFKICAGGVNGMNADAKVRFMKSLGILRSQNYDSLILDKLNKICWSKRADTNRIIFVLSDGTPAGNNYGGYEAENHTHSVIKKIRGEGTSVIAISLVNSVVTANNRIYGEAFNVDASRSLKESFSNLIVRLQKENRL